MAENITEEEKKKIMEAVIKALAKMFGASNIDGFENIRKDG